MSTHRGLDVLRSAEVLVLNKGQGGELTDWLVRIARTHFIIRLVLAFIIIDEVEAVALWVVREFKRFIAR